MTTVATLELTAEFLRFNPPRFSKAELIAVATRIFGITGRLDELEGERDQNYRLISEDGRCFVLKVSGAGEDTGIVDFQIKALEHLEREAPHIPAPRVVQTLEGETTAHIEGPDGSCHEVRLLTYLPGIPYGKGAKPSRKGLAAIGAFGGALAKTLASFDHASAQHFTPWDMNNGLLGSEVLWRYGYPDIVAFERRLRPQFAELFSERLKDARRQVAHFDLHQDNLLRPCDQEEVACGVIDFGDMVHGPLACDAAIIAASFAALDNPVESMTAVVSGYHQVYPLEKTEISLIYELVLARLTQTILLNDFRLKETANPPEFLLAMRPEIMETLEILARVDGEEITRTFLSACQAPD